VLRHRFRLLPLLLLLVLSLAAFALAACGGSSGSGPGRSDEEKRLAFEDCLRDEGLDVQMSPDGKRTAIRMTARGGAGSGSGPQTFGGPDDENGPFARCREKTGWAPSPPTAAEQARARDEGLKLARCMRAHGVDMADPAPDGRMLVRIREDSPTQQAAMRACGMGGPGGPGGPGAGKAGDAGFAVGGR
jgi:hypothetical protein